jgi:hypothetical protein
MEATAAKNGTVEQLELIRAKLDKTLERINQARGVLAALMGARIPGEEIRFEFMNRSEFDGCLWALEALLEQAEEECETASVETGSLSLQAKGLRAA